MSVRSRVQRLPFVAAAFFAVVLMAQPAQAQLRQQIANKVVDDIANQMVTAIQNDSCPEFQQMLKKKNSGGGNSGRASAMMKKNPAMRERFVNKVAGPLVNKLIDCDMLPKS